MFVKQLIRKTHYRYSFIENLLSIIIGGLLCECLLLIYLISLINTKHNDPIAPIIKIEYVEYIEEPMFKPEPEIIEVIPVYVFEDHLTAKSGIHEGPTGKETWYNLPMDGVINKMHEAGYYMDYSVREDGVKTYGDYVMLAADLEKYPRGTILNTSLGKGIVCDTGTFIDTDVMLDIATDW